MVAPIWMDKLAAEYNGAKASTLDDRIVATNGYILVSLAADTEGLTPIEAWWSGGQKGVGRMRDMLSQPVDPSPVSFSELRAFCEPPVLTATCEACGGKGRQRCGSCQGSGWIRDCSCPNCKGHECEECDSESGHTEPCYACSREQRRPAVIYGAPFERALIFSALRHLEAEAVFIGVDAEENRMKIDAPGQWTLIVMGMGYTPAERAAFDVFPPKNGGE